MITMVLCTLQRMMLKCMTSWRRIIVVTSLLLVLSIMAVSVLQIPRFQDNEDHDGTQQDNNNIDDVNNKKAADGLMYDSSRTKLVAIVAYQRSGSTFVGNVFSANRDVFYTFEPLDALYTSLYGTSPGWNVPSDITHFANGTRRVIPVREVDAVTKFLRHLFTCDFDQLPTEFLVHLYWVDWRRELNGTTNYIECLMSQNSTHPKMSTCYDYTQHYCGPRFGRQTPTRLDECFSLMTNATFLASHSDPGVRLNFTLYQTCMDSYRGRIEALGCLSMLRTTCVARPVRVTKLVRATMFSMERLLRLLPNLHVVHLVRDPRAVALSRREFDDSGRGLFTLRFNPRRVQERAVSEAMLYCNHVTRDLIVALSLDVATSRRLTSLRYEDFVGDISNQTRRVYEFVRETAPTDIVERLTAMANVGYKHRSATEIAVRWRSKLSTNEKFNRPMMQRLNQHALQTLTCTLSVL